MVQGLGSQVTIHPVSMHKLSKATLLLALLLIGPAPALADESLLLGVFPRRNATLTSQFFSPLAEYLSKSLNRPVKLVTAKDFPTFWRGVKQKQYDIVHYNQYHYVQSADSYDVIASNVEQGSDTIAGALYVREDSGIDTIEQLRGRSIIFGGGEDAMMSFIIPSYLLRKGGLGASDYSTSFASNPPNAVLAVYFKQAAAGGAGDVVMNLPTVSKIADTGKLRYLAVSEPIKHLPWVVRKDLPEALRQQIKQLMVELKDKPEGANILKAAHVNAFSPARDSDYDSTRKIISDVMPEKEQRQ